MQVWWVGFSAKSEVRFGPTAPLLAAAAGMLHFYFFCAA